MKRNLVISAITAAALVGGGAYTAVAMGGDDGRETTGTAARPAPVAQLGAASDDSGNDILDDSLGGSQDGSQDDSQGRGKDDRAPAKPQPAAGSGTSLTASEAAAAALKEYPGAVASVERDDDDSDRHWEIDLFGKDSRWYELRVDGATGRVRVDSDDDDDDHRDDRAALGAASVDVQRATAAALASVPGTVTSAEIDDDHNGLWEIDVRGKDGRAHELNVHAKTGKVTVDRYDDSRDDRGDDDGYDDGHDDSDDHGHDGHDDDGYDD
ncbi:PepSY domain-containing protein [Streptomyces sp. NPDC102274]|uniref:PepSY domain-containing protein n=1 Tax=Streptomyces sp. NPDC102274 TaxID=3366151 RepID=UPI0038031331